jgi:hypothetical protein
LVLVTTLATYPGNITGDQCVVGVVRFSIEAPGILDFRSNPMQIDYTLQVGSAAEAPFDFTFPDTAYVRLAVDTLVGIALRTWKLGRMH